MNGLSILKRLFSILRAVLFASCLRFFECLFHIVNQIRSIFDSNGQPNHFRQNACFQKRIIIQLRMRSASRMNGQPDYRKDPNAGQSATFQMQTSSSNRSWTTLPYITYGCSRLPERPLLKMPEKSSRLLGYSFHLNLHNFSYSIVTYFSKIHSTVLPSTPKHSSRSLSFRFIC